MRNETFTYAKIFFSLLICLQFASPVNGQIVPVGSGSYTKTFPGTDAAGRNDFHRERPSKVAMQLVNRFQQTISGQSAGATIAYACKFAFSGGMSVTS